MAVNAVHKKRKVRIAVGALPSIRPLQATIPVIRGFLLRREPVSPISVGQQVLKGRVSLTLFNSYSSTLFLHLNSSLATNTQLSVSLWNTL